jgi:hypothetical protein
MSAYLTKAKAPIAAYAKAVEPIKNLAEFKVSQVNRQDQLETHIQQVKIFMTANDKLLAFLKNSDNVLIGEFQNVGLPQTGIDQAMKGYRRAMAGQNELSIKIRMHDKNIGDALLGALGLLDDNWGKWRYSTEKDTVLFDDHTLWKKYIGYLKDLEAAQKEEAGLQRQLVELKGKEG